MPSNSRQEPMTRYVQERFTRPAAYNNLNPQEHGVRYGDRGPDRSFGSSMAGSPAATHVKSSATPIVSSGKVWPEERLRDMSMAAIREFYSAADEKEVALCVRELNSPSFYPSMISIWVNDSFERKDRDRDLLAGLLVNLTKSRDSKLLSPVQLMEGIELVLATLEDSITDAPKAAEFLGCVLARTIVENVISMREIGQLIRQGGEEPGRLLQIGLGYKVLQSAFHRIRSDKGESTLNDICMSSNLQLEDFLPSSGPGESRRIHAGPNGYSSASEWMPSNSRQEPMTRYVQERFTRPAAYNNLNLQEHGVRYGDRGPDRSFGSSMAGSPAATHVKSSATPIVSSGKVWPEEHLRDMSMAAIREFYSAADEKEVALCIRELNSPSFYPSMISIWVNDSFERKDRDRDLLAGLLVNLTKSRDSMLISPVQLMEGIELVLATLEDSITDAPKAAEFLGCVLARTIVENVISMRDIGQLIRQGGEEPGRLLQIGLGYEVLQSVFHTIRSDKGESTLNDICTSSNLQLEDFLPSSGPGESRRIHAGPNGYSSASEWMPSNSRQEPMTRYVQERFTRPAAYNNLNPQEHGVRYGDRGPDRSFGSSMAGSPAATHVKSSATPIVSSGKVWPEDRLRDMSMAAIREFYSAADEKEVALCIRELNSPSFYPSMISIWVNDSFERKDRDRDLLAGLLVNLTKSRDSMLISPVQLMEGIELVLATLEDSITDAPKAAEFLGCVIARTIVENVISMRDIGQLIRQGGEEPGRLLQIGLGYEVLQSAFHTIRSDKGESTLNDICTSSNLQLVDFLPSSGPIN